MPLQCRKKRHYNDTIFQLKQHVSWVNGPDSHFGMTQKLKYKIIVAQDIVGVKCKSKLDIDLPGGDIQTVWGVGYKFVDVPGEWAPGIIQYEGMLIF